MKLSDISDRPAHDFREALNVGNTLIARFGISLFSIMLGVQLWFDHPSMFSHAGYRAFFETLPRDVWAAAFLGSGVLMMWRVMTAKPKPLWGWISNGLSTAVWGFLVITRLIEIGPSSMLNYATIVWVGCSWCLLRTEATRRDKETS